MVSLKIRRRRGRHEETPPEPPVTVRQAERHRQAQDWHRRKETVSGATRPTRTCSAPSGASSATGASTSSASSGDCDPVTMPSGVDGEPLVMPADEFGLVKRVAAAIGGLQRCADHDPDLPCRPALGNGLCYPAPAGAVLVPWREALQGGGESLPPSGGSGIALIGTLNEDDHHAVE